MPTKIALPDLLAGWPFKPTLNPYHENCREESSAWIKKYHVFDPNTWAAFQKCNAGLFAAIAYPHADPSHFRIICDLFNFFFILEHLSDNGDGPAVRSQALAIQDALRDPSKARPLGECVLGEMMKSLWSRALEFTSSSSAQRFIRHFSAHTESLVEEAMDRDHKRIRSINDYLDLRRRTVAARPCFDFFILPEDLPDRVISHPAIERLISGAMDMFILANDIYSYNKEQACGEDAHNMVTVVMHEKGLDVQGAMDYIGKLYREIATKFLEDMKRVPSFSEPIDQIVEEFVFSLGNWIIAIVEWSFLSERYFGTHGREVKSRLVIELRQKRVV